MSINMLKELKENTVIDASHIPDLVPILAVVAGANQGAVFFIRLTLDCPGSADETNEAPRVLHASGHRHWSIDGDSIL